MNIKTAIGILMLGLALVWNNDCIGQNNGSALVDKRVTLDDANKNDQSQNQRQQPQIQIPDRRLPSPQHNNITADAQDSMPRIVLPHSSGNTAVKATLDTSTIIVGEQKILTITAYPINPGNPIDAVTLPSLEELSNGIIEALEFSNDTIYGKGGDIDSIVQRVTITSFEQGHHAINHIVVRVGDSEHGTAIAPAEELWLNVAYSADADTTRCELKADISYIKEPYTFWEIVRWILLALLLAAVVLAVVWIVKRRRENKPIVMLPKAKPVPADKRALSELEAIRRKELWQKGRVKKYYTDLTDVVRRFLHNMYSISATEMTTRQTLRAFRNVEDWSDESNELLRQLLQRADMVKFAKSQPEAHEHDLSMQNAIDFVRKVAETHRINNPEKEGER